MIILQYLVFDIEYLVFISIKYLVLRCELLLHLTVVWEEEGQ